MAAAKKPQAHSPSSAAGEWQEPCRAVDEALLAAAGTDTVVVLPAAAAFEHPDRAIDRARAWFDDLGAKVVALDVLNRRDAERDDVAHTRQATPASSTSPTARRCTCVRC